MGKPDNDCRMRDASPAAKIPIIALALLVKTALHARSNPLDDQCGR